MTCLIKPKENINRPDIKSLLIAAVGNRPKSSGSLLLYLDPHNSPRAHSCCWAKGSETPSSAVSTKTQRSCDRTSGPSEVKHRKTQTSFTLIESTYIGVASSHMESTIQAMKMSNLQIDHRTSPSSQSKRIYSNMFLFCKTEP